MTQEARVDDNTCRGVGNASKQTAVFEQPSEVQKYEGESEPRDHTKEEFGAGGNDRA